jgi:hypothetical protein
VLEKRVFEIGITRGAACPSELSSVDRLQDLALELPDVPVLSETLLLMELKSRDRAVDLTEISQLVLGDLGAVLQIMRLAGHEDSSAESRASRIEDCISGLGLAACVEAMSRQTVKRRHRPSAITEIWTHAQAIAESCKSLAEENAIAANPDEAFLVGLFHEIGSLPEILGWEWTAPLCDPELAGLKMAEAWSLPTCVVEYFSGLRGLLKPNRWVDAVRLAHERTGVRFDEKPIADHAPLPKLSSSWMQLVSR